MRQQNGALRLTWHDGAIALGVFVGLLVLLIATAGGIGVTRDESFYFHAATDYIGWFLELWENLKLGQLSASFTQEGVDRHWGYNPEHPVLMKSLFALSLEVFHRRLDWLSYTTSMRLPGMVLAAALGSMVYAFGKELWGRAAGLCAVAFLFGQPRVFFHAHMACFDVPIVTMWFATVWAYWKSLESGRWAWVAGVCWGLALATKLNAFFIPLVLLAHWVLTQGWGIRPRRLGGKLGVSLPPVPWAFVTMILLGPAIFYLHWPRIWFDTFERVRWYMDFHLHHVHYFVNYFGQNLYQPPFPRAFPWVMTLVTVPVVVLGSALVGAVAWVRERRPWFAGWAAALRQKRLPTQPSYDPRGTAVLLGLNFLFAIVLISDPQTPIFGGTKHWMTSMPYLAMVAALGVVSAARWACRGSKPWVCRAVVGALSVCMMGSLAHQTAHNYPHGTSYYNELLGSHRGAADAKMMRQFWGHGARYAVDWMWATWGESERVWTHNATSWAWDAYREDGIIRPTWHAGGMESAWGLFMHQKAFVGDRMELQRRFGTRVPTHVETLDGVPILSIYERAAHRANRLKLASP